MADKFAPGAVQGINPSSGKNEDCLYLNVWTPAKSAKEKAPVLIWIYGSGFAFGYASDPMYNGERLAEKGVVQVNIAYRVGHNRLLYKVLFDASGQTLLKFA